jgi:Zn-dependent peptidase ImmA (M78 family)
LNSDSNKGSKGYVYKRKTPFELEQIAEAIVAKYADRKSLSVIDIEGLVEDLGLTLLPRRGGLRNLANAYTARDWRFIPIAEERAAYPPGYRSDIAEEFAHILLEFELWRKPSERPTGSEGHELTPEQHQAIEEDAWYLEGALLMPKAEFEARFKYHTDSIKDPNLDQFHKMKKVALLLSNEFQASDIAVWRRAKNLKLVDSSEFKLFLDRIPL